MNEPEFALNLIRLVHGFGLKELTKERQHVYFERLRDIPNDRFTRVVDAALDQCERFPTIARLRAIADEVQPERRAPLALPSPEGEQTFFCRRCQDTGFEPFEKWSDVYQRDVSYVRRCECSLENPKLVHERQQRHKFSKSGNDRSNSFRRSHE